MSRYDCVIWDWNGTLMNDVEIACASVNDSLNELNRPNIDIDRYYYLMRDGMGKYYDYLFYPDKAPFEMLTKLFSKYYDMRIKSASLHEGAEETLKEIKGLDVVQAVVSSSHKDKVRRDAANYKIEGYFDEILGADDLLVGSKTERARLYLERKGISPKRTLFVGDMIHDMETALEVGADCVIIPKGHQSRERLCELGATLTDDIRNVAEYVKNGCER